MPFVAKLEAALSTIEEQAVEIAVLKTKLAAYDDRISANTITADTAQRLSNSNAQYARRKTIELYDFPDTVADEDVEMVAVKIISASGVKGSPSDFQAVHRKKNRKVVIAKLKCRKKAREIIQKRGNLKKKKITVGNETLALDKVRIYESMTAYNAFLRFKLRELHNRSKIFSFWFFNGRLHYKLVEDGERTMVSHESELRKDFPDDTDIFIRKTS